MKAIYRLIDDNKIIESLPVFILLTIAISGIVVNLGFIAAALYKQDELLVSAIDKNNELLLYIGYLSLYLSTLIGTNSSKNKLRAMVLEIISLAISFVAISTLHTFTLTNIYLLAFILIAIAIKVRKNSFLPEKIIKFVLYSLYLISFCLIILDIYSSQKIIMGWLFF